MAVYRCRICGAIFDEAKEGKKLSEIPCCPICRQPISNFEKIADAEETKPEAVAGEAKAVQPRGPASRHLYGVPPT